MRDRANQPIVRSAAQTLATGFEPRANGLNLVRLFLAASVVVWHSFPLTGRVINSPAVAQFASNFGVDGFFAISGFLITRSWISRPHASQFVRARSLRIFPALGCCLVLTVALLVPIGAVVGGYDFPARYHSTAVEYVLRNGLLLPPPQYSIGSTPVNVPYPGAWNGSLWTLRWEFACYMGILLLGVTGLVRRRLVLPALWLTCWMVSVVVEIRHVDQVYVVNAGRLGLMFLTGSLFYVYRHYIPVRPIYLVAAGVLIASATVSADYRIFAAVPIAYLLIVGSTFVRAPRLQFRNDISYGVYIYAFPIQQILASTGLVRSPVVIFMAVTMAITSAVALGSWLYIERPALGLKHPSPRARQLLEGSTAE